jgi:hypothetical protein
MRCRFYVNKYISGDERGGFHLAMVNLPLPDASLGFSSKGGKIGWKRDSLSRQGRTKEEES